MNSDRRDRINKLFRV